MTEAEKILTKPASIFKEMKRYQSKRNAIESMLTLHGVSYSNTRVQTSIADRFAAAAADIDEIDRELSRLDREYLQATNNACALISTIEDETRRTVLFMFYVGKESPVEIGEQIGYAPCSVYRFKHQAVETLNECLNKSLSGSGVNSGDI